MKLALPLPRLVRKFGLLSAVASFGVLPATAAHFAEMSAEEVTALLPAPPAPGSMVERSELEVVLQLQATRTQDQESRARAIDSEDVFFFGREILGEDFTPAAFPKTARLFALLRDDFLSLNRTAKGAFARRRPPFVDSRVQPSLRVTDSGSYPSGHGMQSALWCSVLAELAPAHREKFATRARASRWSRIVAGAHFPSDIAAGAIVGEAFAKKVLASPEFQKRFAAARAEFER